MRRRRPVLALLVGIAAQLPADVEGDLPILSTIMRTDSPAEELEDATAAVVANAPPGAERMTTFAVRLPVIVLDHIREVAQHQQRSVTTSALIRRWIEAGIAEDGSDVGDRVVSVQALLELIGRAPRENADR